MKTNLPDTGNTGDVLPANHLGRRKFLSYLGMVGGGAAVLAACRKDKNNNGAPPGSIDLGSGDIGVLNYAYALEQLEAAFYTQVISTPYSGISSAEQSLLTDIRDHEIAHREFYKAVLGAKAIPSLQVNFSSINFSSRDNVLATAKAFEDLGVSAYNGAGQLLTNADYLLLAGKIVSVEARHAAYLRDLISNGSFADNTAVDANGLDLINKPIDVLNTAKTYLQSTLYGGNLPVK